MVFMKPSVTKDESIAGSITNGSCFELTKYNPPESWILIDGVLFNRYTVKVLSIAPHND